MQGHETPIDIKAKGLIWLLSLVQFLIVSVNRLQTKFSPQFAKQAATSIR